MSLLSDQLYFGALIALVLSIYPWRIAATDASDCLCGFHDAATGNLFTDSTIVYFNETDHVPSEAFVVEAFENRYDYGWNTLYRKGASVDNVHVENDTTARELQSLALYCDPSTQEHLVTGASVRTARQDHFYGSFRSMMRSPRKWFPGSALSMLLQHNRTQSWSMDLMNTDEHQYAWISMLAGGVFPDLWLGVNYTTLQAEDINPWYYVEYRVDWTPESIEYYVDGKVQRSVTKGLNGTLPATPAALQWQHWSTGNVYSSQGPPYERGVANVGSVRLFFNSSTTTSEQQKAFDARCQPSQACSMDDFSLRGSSPYPEEATEEWVQKQPNEKTKWIPIAIDIGFGFLSTILLAKTINRRTSWSKVVKKFMSKIKNGKERLDSDRGSETLIQSDGLRTPIVDSGAETPFNYSGASTPVPYSGLSTPTFAHGVSARIPYTRANSSYRHDIHGPYLPQGMPTNSPLYQKPNLSMEDVAEQSQSAAMRQTSKAANDGFMTISLGGDIQHDTGMDKRLFASDVDNPFLSEKERTAIASSVNPNRPVGTCDAIEPTVPLKADPSLPPPETQLLTISDKDKSGAGAKVIAVPTSEGAKAAASTGTIPTKRVDYLAGLIGISALLVTANHFGQTYFDAVINPDAPAHYHSEVVARNTIGSYFLDPLWIGPFLMISTRFLVSGYLRNGKLDGMAQKITMRPFRLLIPVAFVAVLEYFFMDLGAVNWLEYLPSVTWSSWPYTVIPTDAGTFIAQLIQLAYLIPNAAPQIIYYYCTGVLWTIPVQLQGAWQTILAVIMVREIKTPWKRFSFYAFCIVNHWYALSWGSYYYCGVLLADLDLTYKYTKFLHARPLIYFPFLAFVILVAQSGFTIDMVTQHTGVNYATYEYGIHPDSSTGLTLAQAGRSTYPDFFIPRLNGLISTVFLQLIVEISPTVQKFLSLPVFQWIFPHIFTIYLIHGFIFWSLGSWVCVMLFADGLPYWACVLIVAIVCYATLFASMPILTPIIELVGKNVTQAIWEHASQEPAPRRKTLYPFGPEIFDVPQGKWVVGGEVMGESGPKETVLKDIRATQQQEEMDEKRMQAVDITEVSRFVD